MKQLNDFRCTLIQFSDKVTNKSPLFFLDKNNCSCPKDNCYLLLFGLIWEKVNAVVVSVVDVVVELPQAHEGGL